MPDYRNVPHGEFIGMMTKTGVIYKLRKILQNPDLVNNNEALLTLIKIAVDAFESTRISIVEGKDIYAIGTNLKNAGVVTNDEYNQFMNLIRPVTQHDSALANEVVQLESEIAMLTKRWSAIDQVWQDENIPTEIPSHIMSAIMSDPYQVMMTTNWSEADYALLIKLQEHRKYRMQKIMANREIQYKNRLKEKLLAQIPEEDREYLLERARSMRTIL